MQSRKDMLLGLHYYRNCTSCVNSIIVYLCICMPTKKLVISTKFYELHSPSVKKDNLVVNACFSFTLRNCHVKRLLPVLKDTLNCVFISNLECLLVFFEDWKEFIFTKANRLMVNH